MAGFGVKWKWIKTGAPWLTPGQMHRFLYFFRDVNLPWLGGSGFDPLPSRWEAIAIRVEAIAETDSNRTRIRSY